MDGHSVRMGGDKRVFKILTDKPTLKRPRRRDRHRYEDNIRTGLEERGVITRN